MNTISTTTVTEKGKHRPPAIVAADQVGSVIDTLKKVHEHANAWTTKDEDAIAGLGSVREALARVLDALNGVPEVLKDISAAIERSARTAAAGGWIVPGAVAKLTDKARTGFEGIVPKEFYDALQIVSVPTKTDVFVTWEGSDTKLQVRRSQIEPAASAFEPGAFVTIRESKRAKYADYVAGDLGQLTDLVVKSCDASHAMVRAGDGTTFRAKVADVESRA